MIKRIDTDLIANSVQEIDDRWRAIAHRTGNGWSYFGNLATVAEQIVLRARAFQAPITISTVTGKDPDGEGYVLYARNVPPKILTGQARGQAMAPISNM